MDPEASQPNQAAPSSQPQEVSQRVFEQWKEYEQVAVHFNDLILTLRVQALGGVAAMSAVAGLALGGADKTAPRWSLVAVALGALLVLWLALCVLDLLYYNRLLLGAVRAIIDIEAKTTRLQHPLSLSTTIRSQVEEGFWIAIFPRGDERWILVGPVLFYGIVGLLLLVLTGVASYMGCRG